MEKITTDLVAQTLSDEDRELFLKTMGLTESMDKQDAQDLRDQWPDRNILRVIGAGFF